MQLCGFELLALAYHVRAATRRGLTRAQRRPFWLISAALATLVAGGIGFSIVFTSGDKSWGPPMVLAIVARTSIVPILLAALLSFGAEPMDRRARWKLVMDVTTVLGAGLMLMWYLVLGPALSGGHLFDPLRLGSVLFSVGDVVLLVGVGTVMLRGAVAEARRPLTLLLAGTLGYLAVDTAFLYMSIRGVGPDAIIPTLLLAPMLLIMLASVQPPAGTGAATTAARELRSQSRLPYVALASGYGLLVLAAARAGLYPWLGLVAGALLMTIGVAARQILASRENYTPVVTDSLTGLANRLQLRTDLAAAVDRHRRTSRPLAVLLIDLDEFKNVNDTLGHAVGDALLVAARTGSAAGRAARRHRRPARRRRVRRPAGAGRRRRRARSSPGSRPPFEEPVDVDGHRLRLAASIGVALGTVAATPQELLRRADVAMYAAKADRDGPRIRYVDYAAPLDVPVRARATLERDLRTGIDEEQFTVVYQPIVALDGADPAPAACRRWSRPSCAGSTPTVAPSRRPTSSPSPSRPAHRALGAVILEQTCRQAVRGTHAYGRHRAAPQRQRVGAQLQEADFAAECPRGPHRHRPRPAPAHRRDHRDGDAAPELRPVGGTRCGRSACGSRSTTSAPGTPASAPCRPARSDEIKLDRAFTGTCTAPDGRTVAAAVIQMAAALRIAAVAEGIETEAQAHGCASSATRTGRATTSPDPSPRRRSNACCTTPPRPSSSRQPLSCALPWPRCSVMAPCGRRRGSGRMSTRTDCPARGSPEG